MNELIFFAVIIFFSIVESIARSRKRKAQGEAPEGPLPRMPDPAEWERRFPDAGASDGDLPTYDADPSYDDGAKGDRGVRPQPTGGERSTAPPSRPSSEELLPGDLLQELERLAGRAQARKQARPLDLPKESPRLPEPPPPVPTRPHAPEPSVPARRTAVARGPGRARGEHSVHLSHAGYGTAPSSRARSLQDGLDPLAERRSADAEAVRTQLRSAEPSQLRRAIILKEVLDPPVALRE